jgi:hypothetical protein
VKCKQKQKRFESFYRLIIALANIEVSRISFISRYKSIIFLPLALAAFTHLWNPVGFPHVASDESVYLLRTLHVLEGHGPQVYISPAIAYYDHPYFGQLFLGGILSLIGYPNSVNIPDSSMEHTIQMLYLIPRVLMGLLAVVDTFLVYKIAERRYSTNVALVASLFFAVMPLTWLTRWVLLDSIQLPFLLSSILFSMYYTKEHPKYNKNALPPIVLSGIFLGLSIFTKIPAFTMIPLVGLLIYKNNNNSLKALGIWTIPVILIPLIWPAYSAAIGDFHSWLNGVAFQTHRGVHILINPVLLRLGVSAVTTDSVLSILGLAGLAFAVIKRDYFILLWVIPYLFFFDFIDTLQSIYIIPLIPALSVSAAKLVIEVQGIIRRKKVQRILPSLLISAIVIFGLVTTTWIITQNVNSSVFGATAYVAEYLKSMAGSNSEVTVISYQIYSWILNDVFHFKSTFINYYDGILAKTNKVILISDWALKRSISMHLPAALQIQNIYHPSTKTLVAKFGGTFGDAYTHVPVSIYRIGFN